MRTGADGLQLRHAAGHQLGRALADPGRVERPAGVRQFVGDQVAVSDPNTNPDLVADCQTLLAARLTAPSSAGTYDYGACVDAVMNESDTTNNCSAAVRVTVTAPDLVVDPPTVSNSNPVAGASFTLSATVRNQGNGAMRPGVFLRYYSSTDDTITTGDNQVGRSPVRALNAGDTSAEAIRLTAPSSAGTYYYGACVDAVTNESDTTNNCSAAVRVTVVTPPDLVVDPARFDGEGLETGVGYGTWK